MLDESQQRLGHRAVVIHPRLRVVGRNLRRSPVMAAARAWNRGWRRGPDHPDKQPIPGTPRRAPGPRLGFRVFRTVAGCDRQPPDRTVIAMPRVARRRADDRLREAKQSDLFVAWMLRFARKNDGGGCTAGQKRDCLDGLRFSQQPASNVRDKINRATLQGHGIALALSLPETKPSPPPRDL